MKGAIDGLNLSVLRQFPPRPGRRPLLPELSAKAQVALMCRMLFCEGWNDHIAGHITFRLPDGNVLTNPWELAWDEVTASDILTLMREAQARVFKQFGIKLEPEVHILGVRENRT